MKNLRTSRNAEPSNGQLILGKSLTIPDKTLTIQQIIERAEKGLLNPNYRTDSKVFNGDVLVKNPRNLRAIDVAEMAESNVIEAKRVKQLINDEVSHKRALLKLKSEAPVEPIPPVES